MTRERGRPRRADRKDRLIQTRVARHFERVLKHEAERRRLSVSHLIRNVLEDAFELVDNVVSEVDNIVAGSVDLADQVVRDAGKIAVSACEVAREAVRSTEDVADDEPSETKTPPVDEAAAAAAEQGESDVDPTAEVDAWNAVTLNRPAVCAKCQAELVRGDQAHMGISADPAAPRLWLCDECLQHLD